MEEVTLFGLLVRSEGGSVFGRTIPSVWNTFQFYELTSAGNDLALALVAVRDKNHIIKYNPHAAAVVEQSGNHIGSFYDNKWLWTGKRISSNNAWTVSNINHWPETNPTLNWICDGFQSFPYWSPGLNWRRISYLIVSLN